MPHPLVVHCKKAPHDVYIGRDRDHQSLLANRWSHLADSLAEFQVGSREESIERYDAWASEEIERNPEFKALVRSLYGKRLGCWCAPKSCHGETLVRLSRQIIAAEPLKVIIAGPHNLWDYAAVEEAMAASGMNPAEVVSGAAPGIDTLGERWANERHIHIAPFPADWNKWGKKAGPLRNAQMGAYATALVAIKLGGGTPGTMSMIRIAKSRKLPTWVHEVAE